MTSIRHCKVAGSGSHLLGRAFTTNTVGLNDIDGFQEGTYGTAVFEEASFELVFPNKTGSDAQLHRERFGLTAMAGGEAVAYRPGDEWVEVYANDNTLLYVGTPVSATMNEASVTINGADGMWPLKKQREYWAGFWRHAPRDMWEHYTGVWRVLWASDYAGSGPDGSSVRLDGSGTVNGGASIQMGYGGSEAYNAWQFKVEFNRNRFGSETVAPYGGNAFVEVGIGPYWIRFKELSSRVGGPSDVPGGDDFDLPCHVNTNEGNCEVIIEGRDRWVYFMVDQGLVYVLPMLEAETSGTPYVTLDSGSSTTDPYCDVQSMSLRRCSPYLMRGSEKGDYHLPGAPPPGGLYARYYNDDNQSQDGQDLQLYAADQFSPMRDSGVSEERGTMYERIDKTLEFTSGNGYVVSPIPKWQPAGTREDGLWWSVRWSGSVWLPLGDTDCSMSFSTQEEGARLWVGKTRMGEQYADNWYTPEDAGASGGSIRAHFGGTNNVNGWYPIMIEYGQRGTAGAEFELSYDIGGGSTVVPANHLSPIGIYHDQIRGESHYDAIKHLIDVYGYQCRVEPRSLESGSFPGVLVPKAAVGRKTDYVLDAVENERYSVTINADDVADAVIGDAATLADNSPAGGLTAEIMDYDTAASRLMLFTEYESTSDLKHPPLLAQRLASLLALRSSAWEDTQVQPPGLRTLTNTFPVPSSLLVFDWQAGDSIRLNLPRIGVVDVNPRQILTTSRVFYRVGLGPLSLTVKSRPRNLGDFIRRLARRVNVNHRNYQGQVVSVSGVPGIQPTGATEQPPVWVPLPRNTQRVKDTVITVIDKPDGETPWYLWINDEPVEDYPAIILPGKYRIGAYVNRYLNGPGMKVELKTTDS